MNFFRPWLRVAQPDDWTGTLVRLASWPAYFLVLLPAAIGRIPTGWWVFGSDLPARLILGVALLYLLGWLRALAFASLPRAVVQFAGRMWLPHRRGRRTRLRTSEVLGIDVELRPGGEVFTLEVAGVGMVDMCPIEWEGAQRIFRVLDRRVKRARRRRAR